MRQTILCLMLGFLIASCNQNDDVDCPKIWTLDRAQISANARTDSGQLVLNLWNSISPNSIELSQSSLISDFEVAITIDEMTWDTLVSPQFRLEVIDATSSSQEVSGISVNPDAFYCYIGSTDPENRDMRVMHNPIGNMRISRIADTLKCYANIDGVSLVYSDVLHSNDMRVRLVFGTTNQTSGNTTVKLREFEGLHNLLSSTVQEQGVTSDDFSCPSW